MMRLILSGGGLDSAFMVAKASQFEPQVTLLFFDYGQKAYHGEYSAHLRLASKFHTAQYRVRIPFELVPSSPLTDKAMATLHADNEVPARNFLFLTMAFSFALAHGWKKDSEIWIGASPPQTGYKDARQEMFSAFNALTKETYGNDIPMVRAPLLLYLTKASYMKEAVRVFPNIFADTFSCYESATDRECGLCTHCQQKAKLLSELQ